MHTKITSELKCKTHCAQSVSQDGQNDGPQIFVRNMLTLQHVSQEQKIILGQGPILYSFCILLKGKVKEFTCFPGGVLEEEDSSKCFGKYLQGKKKLRLEY